MHKNNCVIFKGSRLGICVNLDKNTEFEILKEQFEKKLEEAKKFFDGAKTSVIFKGKKLTSAEEDILLDILNEKSSMDIDFVKIEHEEEVPIKESISFEKNPTVFHRGSLRSGQVITSEGSVVILGDVNPGSLVKAGANIIVLGTLKGVAHAGADENIENAFVAALSMCPVQIRIGNIITRFPERPEKKGQRTPELAYAENGQIYVAQF